MNVRATGFYEAWHDLLLAVMYTGEECAPRGLKIKELLHTQLVVDDLRANVLVHPLRDLNYRFMVAEFLWILRGQNDVASLAKYNKEMLKFSDDGETLHGAYGRRLKGQWNRVLELLRRDQDTRQAVVTIFERGDLNPIRYDVMTNKFIFTKDCPCTLSLQLLLRRGKLHGVVTMRSNDLFLGLPYDFYSFSQLVNWLAWQLNVDTGSLTLQAGSSHVYEPHFEKCQEILASPGFGKTVRSPYLTDGTLRTYDRILELPGKAEALKQLEELTR